MKIALPIIILTLLAGGCASTKATDSKATKAKLLKKKTNHSKLARTTVQAVLTALQKQDEAAFKAKLSQARLADYDRAYFEMWQKEVAALPSVYASGWEMGKDKVTGKVLVTVGGRHRASVRVRVALEDGQWRWDER